MLAVCVVTTVNTLTPYATRTLMRQYLLACPCLEVATVLVTILSCIMVPAAFRDSVVRPPPRRDMRVFSGSGGRPSPSSNS